MLIIIAYILLIVILFGATVFVHELGHFLVAKWCGLQIDAFSIGFGPALVKKEVNGVTYKIGILPLGGYVALPQMDPTGGELTEREEGAPPMVYVKPWKKILVAVAGAVCNIIFAFALSCIVWKIGKPSAPHERASIVGYVQQDTEAFEKGLRTGDVILTANGRQTPDWNSLYTEVALNTSLDLKVSRGEETFDITLATKKDSKGMHRLPGIGFPAILRVGKLIEGMSAEAAGLEENDIIHSLDGITLHSIGQMIDLVQTYKDKEIVVTVIRDEVEIDYSVNPRYDQESDQVLIGIQFANKAMFDFDQVVHPTPTSQMAYFSTSIFRILSALTTKGEAKQAAGALSGPVGIFYMFWIFTSGGIALVLWFTALLNVNLAIMNMLPLPILDGGHVMFALYEIVVRKPVKPKVVLVLAKSFFMLLISVAIILTWRDVDRFFIPAKSGAVSAPATTNAVPAETAPAAP